MKKAVGSLLMLLCGALACAAPAQAEVTISLKVDGTTSPAVSYSQKLTNPATAGSTSTGAATGRTLFGPMKVNKAVDEASLALFRSMTTGRPFDVVEVNIANGPFAYSYCMKSAIVTSLRQSAENGDGSLLEEIEFRYQAITQRTGTSFYTWSIRNNLSGPASLCSPA